MEKTMEQENAQPTQESFLAGFVPRVCCFALLGTLMVIAEPGRHTMQLRLFSALGQPAVQGASARPAEDVRQHGFVLSGAPDVRPSKVWTDPQGQVHLQFAGELQADALPMLFGTRDGVAYPLPHTAEVSAGYTDVGIVAPAGPIVLERGDRVALVVAE